MFPARLSWFLLVVWAGVSVACREVPAQDSGGALLSEQAAYDVSHYELDVRLHPARKAIEGKLTVEAEWKTLSECSFSI
jgi:hypothetical protein